MSEQEPWKNTREPIEVRIAVLEEKHRSFQERADRSLNALEKLAPMVSELSEKLLRLSEASIDLNERLKEAHSMAGGNQKTIVRFIWTSTGFASAITFLLWLQELLPSFLGAS